MATTAALAVAMPAMAQPEVAPAPEGNRWVPTVIAIFLVLAFGIVSFMSSRRGHQD